jgi:hypothetical protein
MLQEGGVKIWRPRQARFFQFHDLEPHLNCSQVYVGAGKRDYVPTGERTTVDDVKSAPSSSISHSGYAHRDSLLCVCLDDLWLAGCQSARR